MANSGENLTRFNLGPLEVYKHLDVSCKFGCAKPENNSKTPHEKGQFSRSERHGNFQGGGGYLGQKNTSPKKNESISVGAL